MNSNWPELETDILELILKKLTAFETFCLGDVCPSWKTATKSYTSSPSFFPLPQDPLLMLPVQNEYHFLSVANNNVVYKLKNLFQGFPVVGSSYGWLAVLDKKVNPHLYNPLSRAQIQLPLMNFYMIMDTIYIDKVVLSSDPSHGKEFSAAAIYSTSLYEHNIAFCRHGDETWTWTPLKNKSYKDVTYCNGQIYAITDRHTIDVWDFRGLFPVEEMDIRHLSITRNRWIRRKRKQPNKVNRKTYLVESMGELLIVDRLFIDCVDSNISTFGFFVSKLDVCEQVCKTVQSLTDRALFLGDKEAISVSTRDILHLQGNSIYFMENHLKVYNLEEGRICTFDCNIGVNFPQLASVWLVPNPW